jgi:hypothetical protein
MSPLSENSVGPLNTVAGECVSRVLRVLTKRVGDCAMTSVALGGCEGLRRGVRLTSTDNHITSRMFKLREVLNLPCYPDAECVFDEVTLEESSHCPGCLKKD